MELLKPGLVTMVSVLFCLTGCGFAGESSFEESKVENYCKKNDQRNGRTGSRASCAALMSPEKEYYIKIATDAIRAELGYPAIIFTDIIEDCGDMVEGHYINCSSPIVNSLWAWGVYINKSTGAVSVHPPE